MDRLSCPVVTCFFPVVLCVGLGFKVVCSSCLEALNGDPLYQPAKAKGPY